MDLEHSNNLPTNELFHHICHLRSSWLQGAQKKGPQMVLKSDPTIVQGARKLPQMIPMVPKSEPKIVQGAPKWPHWTSKVDLESPNLIKHDEYCNQICMIIQNWLENH